MRFLIVEDDLNTSMTLEKMIEKYGKSDIVVSGEEAIEAFKLAWKENKPYAIIFMDIMLPKIDGQEALFLIREMERSYGINPSERVKVIMTTALEDPRNVVEAYNKGDASAYLVKPINRHRLKEEIVKLGYKLDD